MDLITFLLTNWQMILIALLVLLVIFTLLPLAIKGEDQSTPDQVKVYPGRVGYKKNGVG